VDFSSHSFNPFEYYIVSQEDNKRKSTGKGVYSYNLDSKQLGRYFASSA